MSVTSAILAATAAGTTVRALWVMALAMLAVAAVARVRPGGPRRTVLVRVEQRPAPLYRAPDRRRVRRSVVTLAGASVVAGAVLATAVGLALAVVLNLVGDLLRS
jgi:hypothetical protein